MSVVSFLSSLMMMLPGASDKAAKSQDETKPASNTEVSSTENPSTQAIVPNLIPVSKSFVNCYELKRHAVQGTGSGHAGDSEPNLEDKPQRILTFSFTVEDIKRTIELGDTYVANSKSVKVEPIQIHGQYSVVFHTDGNAFEMPIPNHAAKGSTRIGGIFNPYLQLSCRYEQSPPTMM